MNIARRALVLASLALAVCHGPAAAQEYPSRPIHLIVTVSPGSATDAMARFVSNALSKEWGATVVVENKPGAAGVVGTEFVAKAPPDGYTLLFTFAQHYSTPWVTGAPYDPVRDFEPIARLANSMLMMATKPDSPLRTVRDVIAAAKQKPGGVSYAHAGTGTTGHMAGVLLESMAGIKLNDVPYKNASQVPVDAASGQVDFMIGGLSSSLPLIRAGRLRVLGITGDKRWTNLPEVPTVAESGLPGYENSSPIWVFAPRGTPQPIISKLSQALTRIASTGEFKEYCLNQGVDADPQDAATVKAGAPAESEKWRRLVELTKAKGK